MSIPESKYFCNTLTPRHSGMQSQNQCSNPAIIFTVRGEPASKSNSRQIVNFGGRVRVRKSDKALDYLKGFQRQMPATARQMLECDVAVTIRIWYASRRPDLDESVILDAMQPVYHVDKATKQRVIVARGVYLNDRQVRLKIVRWALDPANPRAEIIVAPLPDVEAAMPDLCFEPEPA